mmetsp:Transcript_26476/g.43713  ORF Transcript_26476/g.43713 Transcript_26476/m.43713 type:complete len:233 (-) Transcript_26476:37-735(-)
MQRACSHSEGICLGICFHSHQASNIDIIPIHVLRTRSECCRTRHSPWRWVHSLTTTKLQPIHNDVRHPTHVLLVDSRGVRRQPHDFLTFTVLSLKTLPSLHKGSRIEVNWFHETCGNQRQTKWIIVAFSFFRLEGYSHRRGIIKRCSHFHQQQHLGLSLILNRAALIALPIIDQTLRPLHLHSQMIRLINFHLEVMKSSGMQVTKEHRNTSLSSDVLVFYTNLKHGILKQHT